jgi:autoinducer 2 (AI-2) kinase
MGTGSLHCLVTDHTGSSGGSPIASGNAPVSYFRPEGCSSLAREFDPDAVLNTLGRVVQQTLKEGGIRAGDISAIGITSQRQGVVFLDREGREIYCGPNIDLRAIFEGAAMDEELGREIYDVTGHFPSLLLAPARLRWFRENRPLIYNETCTVLTIGGWLMYRLTGSLVSEPMLEGEAGLLDISKRKRCPALMDKLGVPLSVLPPLSPGGVPAGALKGDVGSQWGLKEGTPVVLAGPDTQCGLLGMGLVREGQVGAVMGWSGALQMLTSRPRHDEEMRTWAGCYLCLQQAGLEHLWVAEGSLGDAGNAYRWLKDTLLGSNAAFEEAEQLAWQASAAPDGVVAFLGPGPVSALKAGLRLGGLLFPTPLSFQEADRGQLLRAALENVAYSVKANLATLSEVTGLDAQALYLGGGMSSSRTLATALANALGFPVRRSTTPQVSARGAALATAAFTDPSLTLAEVAGASADDYEEILPGTASEIVQHQEYYQQWSHLYKRLAWAWDRPGIEVRERVEP